MAVMIMADGMTAVADGLKTNGVRGAKPITREAANGNRAKADGIPAGNPIGSIIGGTPTTIARTTQPSEVEESGSTTKRGGRTAKKGKANPGSGVPGELQ